MENAYNNIKYHIKVKPSTIIIIIIIIIQIIIIKSVWLSKP